MSYIAVNIYIYSAKNLCESTGWRKSLQQHIFNANVMYSEIYRLVLLIKILLDLALFYSLRDSRYNYVYGICSVKGDGFVAYLAIMDVIVYAGGSRRML